MTHISIFLYNTGMCIAFTIIYLDSLGNLLQEGFQVDEDSIIMNNYVQILLFVLINFPFLFVLSVKGLHIAAIGVFVGHVIFILVSATPCHTSLTPLRPCS